METPLTDPLSLWGIIGVLSGVIVYLYRKLDKLQEQRVVDAKQITDLISGPIENQTKVTDKMYDLLLNFTNKRGN